MHNESSANRAYEKVKGMWKRGVIPGLKGVYLTGEALTPRSWYELPYPMFWAHKIRKRDLGIENLQLNLTYF